MISVLSVAGTVAALHFVSTSLEASHQAPSSSPSLVISLKEQSLASALEALSNQADLSISWPRLSYRDGKAPMLEGRYTIKEALEKLLAPSGLAYEILGPDIIRVYRPKPKREEPPQPSLEPDEALALNEIEITATRRADVLLNLPYSVSSVGAAKLERENLQNFADVSRAVPSVFFTNQGPGNGKFVIRGLADGAFNGRTQSLISTYFDQSRLTFNAPDPGLNLFDVERVEVLRGPQGTLYGSGSLGGLLRIVPKSPDTGDGSADIRAGISSIEGGELGFDAAAAVNLPIIEDKLALRASAAFERLGGYIDIPTLGLEDTNRNETLSARLAVKATPNDWLSITIGGMYLDRTADDRDYGDSDLGFYAKATEFKEARDDRLLKAFTSFDMDIGFADITSTTSYMDRRINSDFDATLPLARFDENVTDEIGVFGDERTIQTLVHETHITSKNGGRLEWMLGAFYSDRTEESDFFISVPGFDPNSPSFGEEPFYAERFDDALQEFAVFGEATFYITNWASITAGARWFDTDNTTSSFINDVGQGNFFAGQGGQRRRDIAPKFVLSFYPSENQTLYLQAAEGYRLGGVNLKGPTFPDEEAEDTPEEGEGEEGEEGEEGSGGEGGESPSGLPLPEDQLDPEPFDLSIFDSDRILQYEVGYKLDVDNGRFTLQASAYYADWSNMQSDQFTEEGLPIAGNVGNARVQGFEVDVAFRPTYNTRLSAYVSHADSRLRQVFSFGENVGAAVGDQLPGAPRWTAAATLAHDVLLGNDWILTPFARYSSVTGAPLLFDAEERRFSADVDQLDLSLSLEKQDFTLRLDAQNVLGRRSNQFSFGNPFSVADQSQAVFQRPFSIRLSAQIRFL